MKSAKTNPARLFSATFSFCWRIHFSCFAGSEFQELLRLMKYLYYCYLQYINDLISIKSRYSTSQVFCKLLPHRLTYLSGKRPACPQYFPRRAAHEISSFQHRASPMCNTAYVHDSFVFSSAQVFKTSSRCRGGGANRNMLEMLRRSTTTCSIQSLTSDEGDVNGPLPWHLWRI